MLDSRTLVLATRGSALAQGQANRVADRIRGLRPGLMVRLLTVSTVPDRAPDRPLRDLGGDKGLFTREIDAAVLDGRAHAAVHSLKDLPADGDTPGLAIVATPERDDPRDALVTAWPGGLAGLPAGARVGTGSPRRAALLRAVRPDLRIMEMRGNVDSRVARVGNDEASEFDAVVLAAAGLVRLGLVNRVAEFLDATHFPPAPAQGILAVVAPDAGAGRPDPFAELWSQLEDPTVAAAACCERTYVRALGATCRSAVGCLAETGAGGILTFRGAVLAIGGSGRLSAVEAGLLPDAPRIGRRAAEALLSQGAAQYLTLD